MAMKSKFLMAIVTGCIFTLTSSADAKALVVAPQRPSQLIVQSQVVLTGKVIDVDKDPVEVTPYRNAPKDQKVYYKIATVKIDEAIIGASGITQIRVGFPADAIAEAGGGGLPGAPGRIRRPQQIALTKDMTGCFFLNPFHEGDFYVSTGFGGVIVKKDKDDGYDKQIAEVKKAAKILEEPLAALKSKEKSERWFATTLILQSYRAPKAMTKMTQEAVPAEENKLLLENLLEMPWLPEGNDYTKPCRSQIWYSVQESMKGFVQPQPKPVQPGQQPEDYNKVIDQATSKYLKENLAKIKLQRFVEK